VKFNIDLIIIMVEEHPSGDNFEQVSQLLHKPFVWYTHKCFRILIHFNVKNVVFVYITHTAVLCLGTFGIVDYTNYDDMKYAVSSSYCW